MYSTERDMSNFLLEFSARMDETVFILLQVISWVHSGESMLLGSFRIPRCLQDAEDLKKDIKHFQEAFEVNIIRTQE
jgi:hypothetical protein